MRDYIKIRAFWLRRDRTSSSSRLLGLAIPVVLGLRGRRGGAGRLRRPCWWLQKTPRCDELREEDRQAEQNEATVPHHGQVEEVLALAVLVAGGSLPILPLRHPLGRPPTFATASRKLGIVHELARGCIAASSQALTDCLTPHVMKLPPSSIVRSRNNKSSLKVITS